MSEYKRTKQIGKYRIGLYINYDDPHGGIFIISGNYKGEEMEDYGTQYFSIKKATNMYNKIKTQKDVEKLIEKYVQ